MTVTAILGAEHDLATTNATLAVLRELGATEVFRNWGVGGSQEVSKLHYELGGNPLVIEAETYVGLSITGEPRVVEEIVSRVRDIVQS